MTRAETVAALIDHGFEDGKDVSCGLYEFVHVAQYVDNYRRAIYSSVMLNVNEDGSVNGLKISNIASSESYKNARFVDGEIKPQISEDDFKDMMDN